MGSNIQGEGKLKLLPGGSEDSQVFQGLVSRYLIPENLLSGTNYCFQDMSLW
jgi:hypothetical protein